MGTRFVASHECPAHPRIKEWFLKKRETDTMLVHRSIINTTKAVRNSAAEKTLAMEQRGATLEELMRVISGQIDKRPLEEGDTDGAIIQCGQCVGLINEIKSVGEVIEEIIQGANSIPSKLNSMAKNI